MTHDWLGIERNDTPLRQFLYFGLADALVWTAHLFAFAVFILLDAPISPLYVTVYLHVKLWAAGNLWATYYVAAAYLAPSANNTVWYYVNMQLIRHIFAAVNVTLSIVWDWRIRQVLVVYCLMGLVEIVALAACAVELRTMLRRQRKAVQQR